MPLTNGSTPTQVNTTTAEAQGFSTVADLPGIGYVVIWQGPGYNPNNALEGGLFGQCYDYAGNRIGNEFIVSNNYLTGFKADADVIGGPGGTFTVTWSSFDNASLGIYMKTMSLGGGTVVPEVQVNTVTNGSEELSQAVRLSNGNIAVIWQGSGSNPGETGVFARLYDADQQPLGGQFQVNSSPTGFNSAPSLTATFGAGFVATWSALGPNGNTDVYLQLIDHTGAKVGSEILVNAPGALNDLNPVIATLANGTYMVAWSAAEPGFGGTEIYAQRFGLNGEKIGEQIHVTAGDFTGSRPAIAATPDGGFAVTYQAAFQTMLRTFDQFGRAGDPWPIAEDVPIIHSRPDIALLGDGSFIVSFHNGEIFTERFRVTDYLTEGDDRAMGTGESDYLEGFGGNDILRGGDGDDIIEGGLGADRMIGGGGRDEVTYANALSAVSLNLLTGGHGGEAQGDAFEQIEQFSLSRLGDRFIGGDAQDVVYGLSGDDNLSGGKGTDYLDGGEGNDLLEGGGDAGDVLNGGDGVDEVTYIRENFGLAIDLVTGVMAGAAFRDTFFSIEKFTLTRFSDDFSGGDAAERVSGGIGDDRLNGRGGNDVLDGNDGNDTLNGGLGADLLTGGFGDDLYIVEGPDDRVIDGPGGGWDIVYALGDFALTAGSEVERLSSIDWMQTNALNLTGNSLANLVEGNAGVNVLNGAGGADTLVGFAGNDIFVVDNGGDQVVESAGGGNDVVYALASYTLAAGTDVERLSSIDWMQTSALNLTGNELANLVEGNAGANVINGGGGADILVGLGGTDSFAFTTALGAGNVDALADFSAADDTIVLDDAVFTQIGGLGALGANAFRTGSAAQDADDRIVYNNATGQLFYDADGNGAGAAVLFATLQGAPALTASDFLVI